jgi:heme A synthase
MLPHYIMQIFGWLTVGMTYILVVAGNLAGSSTAGLGLSSDMNTLLSLLGTALFSGLILMMCVATWDNPVVKKPDPKVRRLAMAGLHGMILQVILGAWVTHTHAGLACPSFPLCLNNFFPIPFTAETSLTFLHRWWGVLMLGLFFHLAITTAKKIPELARPALQVLGLSIAQVFLGIGTVMTGLDFGSRALHAAVGYAIWGILFYLAIRVGAVRWRPHSTDTTAKQTARTR